LWLLLSFIINHELRSTFFDGFKECKRISNSAGLSKRLKALKFEIFFCVIPDSGFRILITDIAGGTKNKVEEAENKQLTQLTVIVEDKGKDSQ
jgi:hypothetical protein